MKKKKHFFTLFFFDEANFKHLTGNALYPIQKLSFEV